MYTRLASNLSQIGLLYPLDAEIKGIYHHTQLIATEYILQLVEAFILL